MRALSYPFSLAPNGGIASTTTYEQIVRGQVIDALMTNQGERIMRPRYGCDVQSALFDPSDELVRRDAATVIQTHLEQFVPRCIVRSASIELGKPGIVYVNIVYRPSLFSADTSVQIPLSSEFLARHAGEEVSISV
jgi:uncharacterized protein